MSKFPSIDILLATYNGGKYLVEQIESIIAQTYPNINIIISDDGSTDNTIEILSEYEKLPNVTIYYNSFGNSNENFGFLVEKATNEFIAFADQDDVWLPEKIEKCYAMMISTNAVLVYSDVYVTDDKLNIKNILSATSSSKTPFRGEFNSTIFLANNAPGCTILAKTIVAKKILPMKKIDVIHDWKLILIASLNGVVEYINEPLMYYRQHDNNQIGSGKTNYKTAIEFRKLLNDFFEEMNNSKVNELGLIPVKKINLKPRAIKSILTANVTVFNKVVHMGYYCMNPLFNVVVSIYFKTLGK